jgi:excinuclease ABC subunit B
MIDQRTKYDLEMLEHAGFCYGIENYSRHLTGRKPGEAPYTLFDYFPKDYLLFVDESHVTYSQIGGMYRGDRSRKETLVNHGFRLPSALDNRPLKQEEFIARMQRTIYVSATPGDEELRRCGDKLIEQIIRPTGLLDPKIEIYPARNQVDRVVEEIHEQVKIGDRTLVSTLTKKSAEHLCEYLQSLNIKVRYMHSDTETLERSQLLKDLRAGVFDVLIGINLLREGLDLPEVSLVCILDADKEGFLRSKRALLQSCGRAARNERGRVFMFADEITDSMKGCIEETERRRKIQSEYNQKHSITPMTVNRRDMKSLSDIAQEKGFIEVPFVPLDHLDADLVQLEAEKKEAVKNLDFERAAQLRDRILLLKQRVVIDT